MRDEVSKRRETMLFTVTHREDEEEEEEEDRSIDSVETEDVGNFIFFPFSLRLSHLMSLRIKCQCSRYCETNKAPVQLSLVYLWQCICCVCFFPLSSLCIWRKMCVTLIFQDDNTSSRKVTHVSNKKLCSWCKNCKLSCNNYNHHHHHHHHHNKREWLSMIRRREMEEKKRKKY